MNVHFQIECRIEDIAAAQVMELTITIRCGQIITAVAMAKIKIDIMDKEDHTNVPNDLTALNITMTDTMPTAALVSPTMAATDTEEAITMDIEVEAALMATMISDHMTKLTGMILFLKKIKNLND